MASGSASGAGSCAGPACPAPSPVSLYSFCFSGHAVFPMIYGGMKDRRRFPAVLLVCFAVSTLSYGFMGVAGYLMYGDAVMSQVTLNLPSGKVSSKVAIYTVRIIMTWVCFESV